MIPTPPALPWPAPALAVLAAAALSPGERSCDIATLGQPARAANNRPL
jgi:hypothetical protein